MSLWHLLWIVPAVVALSFVGTVLLLANSIGKTFGPIFGQSFQKK